MTLKVLRNMKGKIRNPNFSTSNYSFRSHESILHYSNCLMWGPYGLILRPKSSIPELGPEATTVSNISASGPDNRGRRPVESDKTYYDPSKAEPLIFLSKERLL